MRASPGPSFHSVSETKSPEAPRRTSGARSELSPIPASMTTSAQTQRPNGIGLGLRWDFLDELVELLGAEGLRIRVLVPEEKAPAPPPQAQRASVSPSLALLLVLLGFAGGIAADRLLLSLAR